MSRPLRSSPGTKRVIYIEGCSATKVLARVSGDGRVLFTENLLEGLSDPQRRRYVENLIKPEVAPSGSATGSSCKCTGLKTSLGKPLPTAKDIGLPPFTHPLDGSVITNEADFWRTRSASALIGTDHGGIRKLCRHPRRPRRSARSQEHHHAARGRPVAGAIRASPCSTTRPFARYQAAKGRRAMEVLAPDMIHYDDWDLRSPTAMNAKADIHVASFREFVKRRFSEEDCREISALRSRMSPPSTCSIIC